MLFRCIICDGREDEVPPLARFQYMNKDGVYRDRCMRCSIKRIGAIGTTGQERIRLIRHAKHCGGC